MYSKKLHASGKRGSMSMFGDAVHDEGTADDTLQQLGKRRDHALTAPDGTVKKNDRLKAQREATVGDPDVKEHIYQRNQYARNQRVEERRGLNELM